MIMKGSIRKLENPRTEEYNLLKSEILSMNFLWKYLEHTTSPEDDDVYSNNPVYQHCIVSGVDVNPNFLIPQIESQYAELVFTIIRQIFDYNNIDYTQIHRCVINQIHYYDGIPSPPHIDHSFYHKNVLIYLNDFDDGDIGVYDEENHLQRYKPLEDDIVTFDGLYHSVYQPAPKQRRVVIVFTYS